MSSSEQPNGRRGRGRSVKTSTVGGSGKRGRPRKTTTTVVPVGRQRLVVGTVQPVVDIAERRARQLGYDNVADYLRWLVSNDIKANVPKEEWPSAS